MLVPKVDPRRCSKRERKIYDALPPLRKSKKHQKIYKLRVHNVLDSFPLLFNSEFESGNLKRAVRVNSFLYNLYLEFDSNSKNHT